MSRLFPPGYQFTDASGNVVDSGQVFVYDNNTSTLSTVYTDAALSLPASNPTTLGTDGRMTSELFTNATHSIKVLDANNAVVPNYTRDDVDSTSSALYYTQGGTGSVARTVAARLQDFISVKDYGATGDGTTDDRAAIQLAITAAIAAGSSLYFPAGTYLVGSAFDTFSQTQGLGFFGAGRDVTFIKFGAAMTRMFYFQGVSLGTQCKHISFSDLTFTNTSRTYAADLIKMEASCTRFTFDRVSFDGIKGKVFDMSEAWDNNWYACTFVSCGDTGDANIYMANYVAGTPNTGCNQNKFVGCQFENNYTSHFVEMYQDARNNQFIGCKFHGQQPTPDETQSVYIDGDSRVSGGEGNSFSACNFQNQGADHVYITGNAHRNKFTGCMFSSAGTGYAAPTGIYAGVRIENGDQTVVTGCTFDGNAHADYGITLTTADGTIIVGNTFDNHVTLSINKTGGATNTVLHSNIYDADAFTGSNLHDELTLLSEVQGVGDMFVMKTNPTNAAAGDGVAISYTAKDDDDDPVPRAAEIRFVSRDITVGSETIDTVFYQTVAGTGAQKVKIGETLKIIDGITAPAAESGWAAIYVDSADGDLKVKFADGTVKTIVVDT